MRVIAKLQMDRKEGLQRLTKCRRFDHRKMFDAHGKLKPIMEPEGDEARPSSNMDEIKGSGVFEGFLTTANTSKFSGDPRGLQDLQS